MESLSGYFFLCLFVGKFSLSLPPTGHHGWLQKEKNTDFDGCALDYSVRLTICLKFNLLNPTDYLDRSLIFNAARSLDSLTLFATLTGFKSHDFGQSNGASLVTQNIVKHIRWKHEKLCFWVQGNCLKIWNHNHMKWLLEPMSSTNFSVLVLLLYPKIMHFDLLKLVSMLSVSNQVLWSKSEFNKQHIYLDVYVLEPT